MVLTEILQPYTLALRDSENAVMIIEHHPEDPNDKHFSLAWANANWYHAYGVGQDAVGNRLLDLFTVDEQGAANIDLHNRRLDGTFRNSIATCPDGRKVHQRATSTKIDDKFTIVRSKILKIELPSADSDSASLSGEFVDWLRRSEGVILDIGVLYSFETIYLKHRRTNPYIEFTAEHIRRALLMGDKFFYVGQIVEQDENDKITPVGTIFLRGKTILKATRCRASRDRDDSEFKLRLNLVRSADGTFEPVYNRRTKTDRGDLESNLDKLLHRF